MIEEKLPVSRPALAERVVVRFGVTVMANVLRLVLSFVTGLIVARVLGAAAFGDYSFLIGSFAAINMILDMGTSPAYYTFVARRRRRLTFFVVYLGWTVGVQFFGTLLILWLVLPARAVNEIWPGQQRSLVLLAFGASFLMTQIWTMVSQLGEAIRKTVIVQVVAATQAVAHLLLVVGAWYSGWLSISAIFLLLIGEYGLLALVLALILAPQSVAPDSADNDNLRAIIRAFANYCRPLVVYSYVGFLYHFADRWLLQSYGGSRQQGFFSIGQQFSTISLFATTSILNVFWKEMAEASEKGERERERQLYESLRRILFFFSAWISCLLIPYSPEIVQRILGPDYRGAALGLAIMLLYPIHQSVGQLQGTVFYAAGQTSAYSKIVILSMVISIPTTYFILAPRTSFVPGLNLGAVGLASKLVVLQLLTVGMLGYQLRRSYGWSLDHLSQATVLVSLLSLGFVGRLAIGRVVQAAFAGGITSVIIGGSLFYIAGSAALLYFRPAVIGINGQKLREWVAIWPRRGGILLSSNGR